MNKNKMLYIDELQKKEGSVTTYYVLQFFFIEENYQICIINI